MSLAARGFGGILHGTFGLKRMHCRECTHGGTARSTVYTPREDTVTGDFSCLKVAGGQWLEGLILNASEQPVHE